MVSTIPRTHHGGMTGRAGQIGRQPGRRVTAVPSGVAILAAGSLLAALGLSACGPDAAHADTVLRAARAATVELADGGSRPASVGMIVPKGATVRTADGGSASLVAAGRTVLLGSASAVTVVDGQREQLRQGLVMIDARNAPGLALDAGAATVQAPRGALARVERGAVLRAASYRQSVTVRASGRRAEATVDRLHQVQVPDGGVPGRVTPLALTPHDTWERSYVLDLVTANDDLDALAEGLDRNPASGAAVLQAVPASYADVVTPATGEPRSETALAFVLARATHSGGPAAYGKVRGLREDGGSWGVVAALVQADVAAVSAALDALLTATEGPAALAAGNGASTVPPSVLLGNGGSSPAPSASSASAPQSSRAPAGTASPRPSPRPSPSSDPVRDLVTTVTGLLPTAVPTPLVSLQVGPLSVHLG